MYAPLTKQPQLEEINNYQKDINIFDWCNSNKLSINASKTNTMVLSTNKSIKNLRLPKQININNTELEIVTKYKYLGITINQTLTLVYNIKTMVGMVSRKLNTLTHIK